MECVDIKLDSKSVIAMKGVRPAEERISRLGLFIENPHSLDTDASRHYGVQRTRSFQTVAV